MRLDKYLARSRIIDLQSPDLSGALQELLDIAVKSMKEDIDAKKIHASLLRRENTLTTYLGNGVIMPHMRLPVKRRYLFAIGRCPKGLEHDGLPEYRDVHLIFLLLASEDDNNYLNVLASLARLFKEPALVENMIAAPDLKAFRDRVYQGFGGLLAKPERQQSRFNRILLRESEKIARDASCTAIMIFSDTFAGGIEVTSAFPKSKTILVARAGSDRYTEHPSIKHTIEVRSYSKHRLSQLRSAVIVGLTRGIIKFNDRLCCVGGMPSSNQLDAIVIVDVEREFQSVLTREAELLPPNVKVEVMERIFGIATELAVEGREGRPVGTLFVIGDNKKVTNYCKPLILNPFHGYKAEDRNVLNPFMDETLKELSSLDGAFVIDGDGVVSSAGSLLNVPGEFHVSLPSGYGTRHAAAAAVSNAADCIAVAVSSSTGQVTLFRRGVMLPLLEKTIGGNM